MSRRAAQCDFRKLTSFLRVERGAPGIAVLGSRTRRSEGFLRELNAWG